MPPTLPLFHFLTRRIFARRRRCASKSRRRMHRLRLAALKLSQLAPAPAAWVTRVLQTPCPWPRECVQPHKTTRSLAMRPDITVQSPGSKLSIELLPSPTSPIDSGVSCLASLVRELAPRERHVVQGMILRKQDPFDHLHVELLLRIFDFLHPYDVWSNRLVSRRWNSVLLSPKVMLLALRRFSTHNQEDTALDPNATASDALKCALRHGIALRMGRPFTCVKIWDKLAFNRNVQPNPSVPCFQLKGSHIAYLHAPRERKKPVPYHSDTVVVRNLITGRSATLSTQAHDDIKGLSLSSEIIAFVLHIGILHVALVSDLAHWQEPTPPPPSPDQNNQTLEHESASSVTITPHQLTAASNRPQQSARLSSSSVMAMASDVDTVVCLLHDPKGDTAFIFSARTSISSSFPFQVPHRTVDVEGAGRHALLVDSRLRRIDIFSVATVRLHTPRRIKSKLRVVSSRYSFDGELMAQTIWEDSINPNDNTNSMLLGPVRPTGYEGLHAIDFRFTRLLHQSQWECQWTLLFDAATMRMKAINMPPRDLRHVTSEQVPVHWKDRLYTTVPPDHGLHTLESAALTDEPMRMLSDLLRNHSPQSTGSDGCFRLEVHSSGWEYQRQHIAESRVAMGIAKNVRGLFVNDTFAVQAYAGVGGIVVWCFDERVAMHGAEPTEEWSEDGRIIITSVLQMFSVPKVSPLHEDSKSPSEVPSPPRTPSMPITTSRLITKEQHPNIPSHISTMAAVKFVRSASHSTASLPIRSPSLTGTLGLGVLSSKLRSRTSASRRSLQLRVTAARPGTVNFELDIKKEHTSAEMRHLTSSQNRLNILHGGTLACMTDLGGSLAVASRGLFATGVSTDLSVTYLASGGKIGDVIRAEVTCDKFGKTLAYTSIRFMNEQQELVARGSHTKFVALAWKDPQNITEELSPKPQKTQ
ncbi:hypothetical protein Q7P37_003491 [Cladosporium fusiforme]